MRLGRKLLTGSNPVPSAIEGIINSMESSNFSCPDTIKDITFDYPLFSGMNFPYPFPKEIVASTSQCTIFLLDHVVAIKVGIAYDDPQFAGAPQIIVKQQISFSKELPYLVPPDAKKNSYGSYYAPAPDGSNGYTFYITGAAVTTDITVANVLNTNFDPTLFWNMVIGSFKALKN
jgi:hypothetical protein